MKSPFNIALILAIGAVTGLGSAYLAVASGWQPSALTIGPWKVVTSVGLRDADPYARAIIARTGDVPLGAGEGVLFLATDDSDGRPLSGACVYRLIATTPVARAWSLTLTDLNGRLIDNPSKVSVLTSGSILRPLDGPPTIGIAAEPVPGNWLPAAEGQFFELVLRLYEAPVANTLAAIRVDMLPRIERLACR